MRSLLFWTALPLVLPQALWVRRTAPRFAPAGGDVSGGIGSGTEMKLLAIGDSIVAGVGAGELGRALVGQTAIALTEHADVRVSWHAYGRVGVTIERFIREHLDRVPGADPDFVIVSLGVNDVTSLSTVRRWRENLRTLFDRLRDRFPEALIFFAGIPPLAGFPLLPEPLRSLVGLRGETLDAAARDVVAGYDDVVHVPVAFDTQPEKFSADGFHPSETGYREFGQAMAAAILLARPAVAETTPNSTRSIA